MEFNTVNANFILVQSIPVWNPKIIGIAYFKSINSYTKLVCKVQPPESFFATCPKRGNILGKNSE